MRAARALLRWTALDLAKASRVGVATIRRVEVVEGPIPVTAANEAALRSALEAARRVTLDMRTRDEIGDDAFHRLEEDLDWMEMSVSGAESPAGG